MADPAVLDQAAPVTNQQVPAQSPEQASIVTAPEPDLLTKVAQFKKSQPAQDNITNAPEQPEFEAIKDPVAREAAKQAVERMRRGMQSDYTRKLEEAKSLVEQSKTWTPQRIQQELLSNPDFLQAAQMVAGNQAPQNPVNSGLTDEQFSALTDREKSELASLKSEVSQLKQNNVNQAIQKEITYKDAELKVKYPDYNPAVVDQAMDKLGKMSYADVREYVYKAITHDETVKSVYEMAKSELKSLNQEKINAITPSGSTAINTDAIPTREKGESDQAFFLKLGQFRLAQSKKR